MYKKSIIALLFLLSLSFSTHAQDKCERFTDKASGVSFCAPTGWGVLETPELGRNLYGARADGFTRNMNVRGAAFRETLAQVADLTIAYILKTKPGGVSKVETNSRTSFTAGKKKGIKVVYKSVLEGRDVKTIQYFFSGKGQHKVVITATILWSDTEVEKMIDDAVKTLEITK